MVALPSQQPCRTPVNPSWPSERRSDDIGRRADSVDPADLVLRQQPGSNPYPGYQQLRAAAEVITSRRGTHLVLSHHLCKQVLHNSAFLAAPTFSRRSGSIRESVAATTVVHPIDDSFLSMNPPDHGRLRELVAPWFSPRAISRLRPFIEQTVNEQIMRLADRPTADLVTEFSLPITIRTICAVIGLPPTDEARFVSWTAVLSSLLHGIGNRSDADRLSEVLSELASYLGKLFEYRRRNPTGDLLSRLVTAEENSQLSTSDLLATIEVLLVGGFETTANLIGNAVLAFLDHPAQQHDLLDDLQLIPALINEVLRLHPPVQYTIRTVARPTDLGGRTVLPGQPIVVLIGAANRDPTVFRDPDQLWVLRPNAHNHLGFGAGIHYCLGAPLARLQTDVALRALWNRFPDLHLSGEPQRQPSRVIWGLQRLLVELTY